MFNDCIESFGVEFDRFAPIIGKGIQRRSYPPSEALDDSFIGVIHQLPLTEEMTIAHIVQSFFQLEVERILENIPHHHIFKTPPNFEVCGIGVDQFGSFNSGHENNGHSASREMRRRVMEGSQRALIQMDL